MGDCSLQPGTPACVPCSRLRRIIACWLAEAPGGVTPLSTLCLNTVFARVFSFSGDELHCSGAGHSASSSSSSSSSRCARVSRHFGESLQLLVAEPKGDLQQSCRHL